MKKKICSTNGCDKEVYCKHLCQSCYQNERVWADRSEQDKKARMESLNLWVNRMSKRIKVTPINKPKKKKPKRKSNVSRAKQA